ncbi:MAG: hypothetical protein V2A76_15005 [Planctomycetota bacterium]
MPRVVLLGPQRLQPTIAGAIRAAGIKGKIATVTAGWEERELEDDELAEHLAGRARNLQLWERSERALEQDPELTDGLRRRNDRLRAQQRIYRGRLTHALDAVRDLLRMEGDADLLDPEREEAFRAVRQLDQHHLKRVQEIRLEFDEQYRPSERDAIMRHRAVIARRINDSEAICIAGGHVAVLLNRLRIFDLLPLVGDRPVFAWSAGAMVLGETVVLFHDSPPQGKGYAEVLDSGLAYCKGLLPFPDARRRLRLDDPLRVQLLKRRFDQLICVPMDRGARLEWIHGEWVLPAGTRRLSPDGSVRKVTKS